METGQHLAVGQMLGSIYRAGAFDIEVKIPLADLAWFPDGNIAETEPSVTVHFTETTQPRRWSGRLARVKATLDATTRTLPVVIEVDEPVDREAIGRFAERLKPGMFVTVSIHGRQVADVHRLPRHLLHDGDTVFIADGDRLTIRLVTVLRRFKTAVVISEGLSDGDLVVTTPLSGAVAGMRIRIEGLRD